MAPQRFSEFSVLNLSFGPRRSSFGQNSEFRLPQRVQERITPDAWAKNPSTTNDQSVEDYAGKLGTEGVEEAEVARRVSLIRTSQPQFGSRLLEPLEEDIKPTAPQQPMLRPWQLCLEFSRGVRPERGQGRGRSQETTHSQQLRRNQPTKRIQPCPVRARLRRSSWRATKTSHFDHVRRDIAGTKGP